MPTEVRIHLEGRGEISGVLSDADAAFALLVLAHGAGAGMRHPFMENVAAAFGTHGVATLRYQFPYMEAGSRRTDRPTVAHAAVRAAVTRADELAPDLPLFAGGKSFGGRMTSQAMALSALPRVRGIVFVGFPLHPAGKPGTERAEHLGDVAVPMLFLQGTRDALARLDLVQETAQRLGRKATLHVEDDADHSFAVRKRSGRNSSDVIDSIARRATEWMQTQLKD